MLARMWNNRNSHLLLVEMQNVTTTLEDSLVVPYKTKHTLTLWSSNHAPWYLPKGAESTSHKKLAHGCYSRFIHNCQNLEVTKTSFSR